MNQEKVFIGIQSRLSSSRFPQKSFALIHDIPLIVRVIKRFQQFSLPHVLVLLCPENETQDFQDFLQEHNCPIPIIGGDEHNVLSRYYKGAKEYNYPLVMRVTGDNPLISIPLAEMLVQYHLASKPDLSHYLQNPLGTGVELMNLQALEKSYREANTNFQQEHVTQYIYQHPELFYIEEPTSPFIVPEYPHLSVDYPEDIQLIESLLEKDPEWDISRLHREENI